MIEIVRLRAAHFEQLKKFFSLIDNAQYTENFSPHPFDLKNAERVCDYSGRDKYFALLLNGETVIGYGMLRGWDEGYAVPAIGLCVLKEYQRKGLGKLFMNFLETVCRMEGASKVMLKVKKTNTAAKNLYLKQGFEFKEHNDDFLVGHKKI